MIVSTITTSITSTSTFDKNNGSLGYRSHHLRWVLPVVIITQDDIVGTTVLLVHIRGHSELGQDLQHVNDVMLARYCRDVKSKMKEVKSKMKVR